MATSVVIYVDDEIVATVTLPSNPISFYQKILDAVKNNPTMVDITNMENYPVEGMRFENNVFIETEELKFISNPGLSNSTTFAFVVDGIYVATEGFHTSEDLMFISAYQSNPRFEVLENVESIYF
jgi:hypothetical protein